MVSNSPVQQTNPERKPGRGAYVGGVVLLIVGILLLLSQLTSRYMADWWEGAFPVLLSGLVFVLLGLFIHKRGEAGFLVPGFIITGVGSVMLYQQWSQNPESWSYLWPVAAPGGVALAVLVSGLLDGKGKQIKDGLLLLAISVVLLVAFAIFFEGVIFGRWAWLQSLLQPWVGAAIVIIAGAVLLVIGLMRGGRKAG